jgi:hypothetical protein
VGGLWLWNTRLPSGLVMVVVVPSGFRVIVQCQAIVDHHLRAACVALSKVGAARSRAGGA